MNFFDILTLIALVWAVISGWRSGFISQLLGLIGIVLGVVLSIRYGAEIGAMLHIDTRFSAIAGFLITFVTALIVATILAKLISRILSFIGLGWVNTLLGVVLAMVKGVLVLSLFYASIYALNTDLQAIEPQYFENSISFDVVRECAEPLLEYWEEAKQAVLSQTPKA